MPNKPKFQGCLNPNEFKQLLKCVDAHTFIHPNESSLKLLLRFYFLLGINTDSIINIRISDICIKLIDGKKFLSIDFDNKPTLYIRYKLIKKDYESTLKNRCDSIMHDYLFYPSSKNKKYSTRTIYSLIQNFLSFHKKLFATEITLLDSNSFKTSTALLYFSHNLKTIHIAKSLGYKKTEIKKLESFLYKFQ